VKGLQHAPPDQLCPDRWSSSQEDLATGVVVRLPRARFPVVVLKSTAARPPALAMAKQSAGRVIVEGIEGRQADSHGDRSLPTGSSVCRRDNGFPFSVRPAVVVDGRMKSAELPLKLRCALIVSRSVSGQASACGHRRAVTTGACSVKRIATILVPER
jgi:hypothetical protein